MSRYKTFPKGRLDSFKVVFYVYALKTDKKSVISMDNTDSSRFEVPFIDGFNVILELQYKQQDCNTVTVSKRS